MRVVDAVIGLLLDQVVTVAAAHLHPVGDMLTSSYLTGREVEVLQLLARGLSNREIAERLVISRRTAAHHVEHIYTKTGTTNRALASLFAANHGLIKDPAEDVSPGEAGSRSRGPASR